ncbi:hypothetical protein [Streptomyces sp. NPDC048282]|uniref:hypothetical protein n=1 Tax=Streptomyces sp. NPDC048282 TaxID=3365528 RepID=UPI00372216D6
MGDRRGERPVPRDMQDQQAGTDGRDPWDAAEGRHPDGGDDAGLPETDEAGTGPRGAPGSGAVHPGDPLPDEPSD